MEQVIRRTLGFNNWLRDAYKVRRSRPSELSPRAGRENNRLFCSMVGITGCVVGGSYEPSSTIVESKAVDKRGERRRIRITDERQEDGLRKHSRRIDIA